MCQVAKTVQTYSLYELSFEDKPAATHESSKQLHYTVPGHSSHMHLPFVWVFDAIQNGTCYLDCPAYCLKFTDCRGQPALADKVFRACNQQIWTNSNLRHQYLPQKSSVQRHAVKQVQILKIFRVK